MQRLPAHAGDLLAAIETPALVVDLDALERNLDRMADATKSIRLRPHAKSHKCATIAKAQLARGAVGARRCGVAPVAQGERVWLIPGHCDPTVNLYDWIVAVRSGVVGGVWPIEARGALG